MNRSMFAVLHLVVFAAASRGALAQSAIATVAVNAGSATDQRGIRSDAITLAPAAMLAAGANTSLMLGVSATHFANSAWLLGAGGSLSARTSGADGLALSLNSSAGASQASFNATFAQADATPALEFRTGPLTLVGGAHVAAGYTAVSTQANPAPPGTPAGTPGLPFGGQLVSESRTSVAPSYGVELRFGAYSPVSSAFSYREEPAHVGGVLVTDRMAGAVVSIGAATLSAVAGHRSAVDENVGFASGSASIPITSIVALTVAGGQYPSNRLTGAAGGRFFSTGFSLRFGGPRAASLPEPSGVRPPDADATRLSIRAPGASRVEVAGDWDSWTPAPATRASNGVWYVDLPLKAGEYRYAFRVDGKEWRVPEGTVAVDDGFGGKSAYVTVRAANTSSEKHNQEER